VRRAEPLKGAESKGVTGVSLSHTHTEDILYTERGERERERERACKSQRAVKPLILTLKGVERQRAGHAHVAGPRRVARASLHLRGTVAAVPPPGPRRPAAAPPRRGLRRQPAPARRPRRPSLELYGPAHAQLHGLVCPARHLGGVRRVAAPPRPPHRPRVPLPATAAAAVLRGLTREADARQRRRRRMQPLVPQQRRLGQLACAAMAGKVRCRMSHSSSCCGSHTLER
jgi:hypothetical protein